MKILYFVERERDEHNANQERVRRGKVRGWPCYVTLADHSNQMLVGVTALVYHCPIGLLCRQELHINLCQKPYLIF